VNDRSYIGRTRPDDGDVTDSPLVRLVGQRLDERGSHGYRLRFADVWCYVEPAAGRVSPPQGWKLHVSAAAPSALEVLGRAFDLLVDERCAFKFASTMGVVKLLNSPQYPRGGAGKFMTVYPDDDAQFVRLAKRLHEVTVGLVGQTILSDRPYTPGSLVHYRYGAFSGRARRGNDSEMRYYLLAPDGAEVEDRRDAWFSPPPWARAPLPEPASEAGPGASVLLHGRYLAREAIRHANKGGVFLATDTETGDDVVIKQARRHVGMAEDGWEVRDGVRNEAEMLDLLASTGFTPRRLALFEQQSDLFLVEEYIPGLTLRQHAGTFEADGTDVAAGPGSGPSWTRTARLGLDLVDLLDTVHRAGLVLRDFSPNNVIVRPDGRLALVDLEFAVPVDTVAVPVGTPGYVDPDLGAEVRPVTYADDLYGLGTQLYLLATASDPYFAMDDPPGRSMSDRIAGYLAMAASESEAARRVAPLVLGLVDPDPAARWSLARTRAFLTGAPSAGSQPAADAPPATVPFPAGLVVPSAPDRDRILADGLGWLAEAIAPATAERLWPTTCFGLETDPCAVQNGAAGVAAALLLALRLGHGDGLREPLERACRWLVERTADDGPALPGLYFGRAGVAWVLHDAGRWFADPEMAAHGADLAERLPLVWPNADVTHGSAGAGLLQLYLWLATGEERFAQRLRIIADGIAEQAQRQDGKLLWPVPAEFDSALAGKAFYGFAHGNAGIGWLLLAAGIADARPDWRALAAEAGQTLCGVALRRPGGTLWPSGPDEPAPAEVWCNGSSGVGTFLVRLWQETGEDRLLVLADEAARAVWSARRYGSPAQCHGLAGNGEFLLDMAEATGDDRYRGWAGDLADAIVEQYVRRGRWYLVPDESRSAVTASFGIGLAGTLAFLLRLAHGTPRMWMADPAVMSVGRVR
jgi:hypothetical protein